MPLHLPPISRRRFLTSSLAAGVGVLTWHMAPGAERTADPDRWALLSDTHIAADRDLVHLGVRMADNLARVVAEVAECKPRPAGVLLNGDAAYNKGQPGDYGVLVDLLRPLSKADLPIHFTLGNHDHRDNFRTGLRRGQRASPLASRHVSVVEAARVNWFLLDSLDKVSATPGELGTEQIDWLAKALDARADKPALVVVHHNPQWTTAKRSGIVDTELLFAQLVPRKHVKAVIFGHTHQWRREKHEGIHLINLPPVAYLFNKELPNGWVDAELREGGATLTLHALDAKHRQHGEKVELAWR